ncbi:MAG: IreB family regulatory phosphoprotein [Peptostreptococcaceae bacterium]
MDNLEKTVTMTSLEDDYLSIEQALKIINQALKEKGYNSINQIIGYVLSGDLSYITSHKNARNMIKSFERDEILEEVMNFYFRRK